MTTVRKAMTLDQFLRLRERKPALEYIDGEVTQKVSPGARHSALRGEFMQQVD